MKRKMPTIVLSSAAGFALMWCAAASVAAVPLAPAGEGHVTDDGLHRVHPSVMEAAWVKPDFDLSSYRRVLLMPTAVQFRDVPERSDDARTRAVTEEFSLSDDRKEWLRGLWRRGVEARFAREDTLEHYDGGASNVLIVQGFLVDVVSRIPPVSSGSTYMLVNNPWSVNVIVELRDGATGEVLARTVDRRNAHGLLEVGAVWHQTEDLVTRWAGVMTRRLDELSELGGWRGRTPAWWASEE